MDMVKQQIKGFMDFIREQGVLGLAIGFILGGSVSTLAKALVADIIDPVLSVVLGSKETLAEKTWEIGAIHIMWGHFLSALVDFVVIAVVVYFGFKGLGLDKIDKKKEK
jgi:large conductance mechanosensitive channel